MTSTSDKLHKLLSGNSDYCCLCFQDFVHTFYNLDDEIFLDADNSEDLSEILTTVLGNEVQESLASSAVCRKCTETAINSYKFITASRNNVLRMANGIDCLYEHTYNEIDESGSYRSLFFLLDINNYSVNNFYDKKKNSNKTKTSQLERFKNIFNKSSLPHIITESNYSTVDIDPESNNESIIYIDTSADFDASQEDLVPIQLPEVTVQCEMNDENGYKCNNCMKVFQTKVKLKQHYLGVHAPKNFTCTKCNRSFGSLWLLNRHDKDSHSMVVCSQCGKTYNSRYSLQHEKTHTQRLVCQSCGKVYRSKIGFNNHIKQNLCKAPRKSITEGKFSCHYCNKKYSQKPALGVHIRVEHENGRALICDWCGKKLASLSRLKDHVLTHTKQKDFACDICGGKFVTKASLLYHTRIHTGEKPYKCDVCDMRFLSSSRRSQHMKWHHVHVSDLECDICHSKFKLRSSLTRHRKRHFNASSKLFQQSSVQIESNKT